MLPWLWPWVWPRGTRCGTCRAWGLRWDLLRTGIVLELAAGLAAGLAVGIAVICREYCRGVPWVLPFTVGLKVTALVVGISAAVVPRHAVANVAGCHDMSRHVVACRGHCRDFPRHGHENVQTCTSLAKALKKTRCDSIETTIHIRRLFFIRVVALQYKGWLPSRRMLATTIGGEVRRPGGQSKSFHKRLWIVDDLRVFRATEGSAEPSPLVFGVGTAVSTIAA